MLFKISPVFNIEEHVETRNTEVWAYPDNKWIETRINYYWTVTNKKTGITYKKRFTSENEAQKYIKKRQQTLSRNT